MRRVAAGAFALGWLFTADARADCIAPPPIMDDVSAPADAAAGQTRIDRRGRVVAPVSVNGQGPFRFIVDTGANRSAISPSLAAHLGLSHEGLADVHSIEGVNTVPLAPIASLSYQRLALPSAPLPVLQNARVLAGEDGLLGVDGMQGRRLRMDFVRQCIEIVPSRGAPPLRRNWVDVNGELRFGSLVVIKGRIRDIEINILLDTGADTSFGNLALREALAPMQVRQTDDFVGRAYTAGRPILFERAAIIPRIRIGNDLAVTNVTAFLGDMHIFALWGFQDEPTLLVGMDVISQTDGLAIDYGRASVHFRVPQRDFVVNR